MFTECRRTHWMPSPSSPAWASRRRPSCWERPGCLTSPGEGASQVLMRRLGRRLELRLECRSPSIGQPLTSTWWRSWPTGSNLVWCTCSLHLARQQFCLSWLRASRCVLWVPCLQATLFKFLGSFLILLSSRCCWPMTVTVTSIYVTTRLHSGSLHLASRRVPEADLPQLHGRQESALQSPACQAAQECSHA